jgi:hypothetical protein
MKNMAKCKPESKCLSTALLSIYEPLAVIFEIMNMNYLKYKKKYPLTLSNYFKWAVEDIEASNSFDNYLESFFNGSVESGSDGGEYYYNDLHIDQEKYIKAIKKKFPELYDEYREEIIISLVENKEDAYKCVEHILLKGYNQ